MLSDEEIEDCISEACKSLRRHRSAIRGQMCVPADQLDWHVARVVERAAYERAAQECIETAAELRRCADGCTDGRYDWKADGALDCADAIRALGGQHD